MDRYESDLVSQWQADGPQRKGYRQLAEWFNVLLLRREMDRAGLSTLGDEAESKYERLTADGTVAEEVANSLGNDGLPIEQLRDDFVSYGVIRTHLKECLGEEVSFSGGDWEQDTIEIVQNHAVDKIAEAVSSLQSKEQLTAGGDLEIAVTVELECDNCHTRIPIERAMRRGHVCTCTE
ncbi:hypothetical protein D8Y22_14925 [Salinadaptatus halalkaliphilus]|uniref:Uncharacterized protein n=2 Tax=Salinadaptatus halalkaliphilus TaxID=2419781 RepID=A0A4S3TLY9_9EURY|nr:hypothetical protein D8Y22_14925 [Salinadaptatus halalkaliphilus]